MTRYIRKDPQKAARNDQPNKINTQQNKSLFQKALSATAYFIEKYVLDRQSEFILTICISGFIFIIYLCINY